MHEPIVKVKLEKIRAVMERETKNTRPALRLLPFISNFLYPAFLALPDKFKRPYLAMAKRSIYFD